MEKKKDFEELYNDICNNSSDDMKVVFDDAIKEKRRVNILKVIICLIFNVLILCIIIFKYSTITKIKVLDFNIFSALGIILAIIIFNVFICLVLNLMLKRAKEYNYKFKEVIVTKIMENFYDDLEYFPNKALPEYLYKEVDYNEYYDDYSSEDYMEARIKSKYNIDLAEVLTQKEEYSTDSQGRHHTHNVTVFHGLFAEVVIDKSINTELKIVQNGELILDKKRIEMDYGEFEKCFDVSSDNRIVAMQILTPDIMQELIDFLNEKNSKFDIIIKNNNIYIRFHCGSMFEAASLKKGTFDKETLKKYYDILNFTYRLSSKLIETINDVEI